jgi:hypothetical protein
LLSNSLGAAGGRHQPFCYVLVDMGDRPNQTTYVAQENIIALQADMQAMPNLPPRPVNHPDVSLSPTLDARQVHLS